MYPQKCFVMNQLGENVFQVLAQLIRQSFCYPSAESYVIFTNESLSTYFQELSGLRFTQILFFLIPEKENFSFESDTFRLSSFAKDVRQILQILAKVLGREDAMVVDKSILGMFALMMKPGVVLHIPTYLESVINNQFMSLSITGSFRFPYLVTYLFLYSHVGIFIHLGLNIVDVNKNKKLVVFWTYLVGKEVGNEGLF